MEEDHDTTSRGYSSWSPRQGQFCTWKYSLTAKIRWLWRGSVWPSREQRKSHGPWAALPVFKWERMLWCFSNVFWRRRAVVINTIKVFVASKWNKCFVPENWCALSIVMSWTVTSSYISCIKFNSQFSGWFWPFPLGLHLNKQNKTILLLGEWICKILLILWVA